MRELYLIPLSHIISVSAIQTRQNNQVDDPFAEVFEGDAGTDDVIRDTGQYKFVGSLFPKKPIMPNSEVGFSVADRLEPVKGNIRVFSLQYYKNKIFQILFSTPGMIPNRKTGLSKVQESLKLGYRKKN